MVYFRFRFTKLLWLLRSTIENHVKARLKMRFTKWWFVVELELRVRGSGWASDTAGKRTRANKSESNLLPSTHIVHISRLIYLLPAFYVLLRAFGFYHKPDFDLNKNTQNRNCVVLLLFVQCACRWLLLQLLLTLLHVFFLSLYSLGTTCTFSALYPLCMQSISLPLLSNSFAIFVRDFSFFTTQCTSTTQ